MLLQKYLNIYYIAKVDHLSSFKHEIFWIRKESYCYIVINRPHQEILHVCNDEAKASFLQ